MKYAERVNIIESLGFFNDMSSYYYNANGNFEANIVENCIYLNKETYKFKSFEDMINYLYVNLPLQVSLAK